MERHLDRRDSPWTKRLVQKRTPTLVHPRRIGLQFRLHVANESCLDSQRQEVAVAAFSVLVESTGAPKVLRMSNGSVAFRRGCCLLDLFRPGRELG